MNEIHILKNHRPPVSQPLVSAKEGARQRLSQLMLREEVGGSKKGWVPVARLRKYGPGIRPIWIVTATVLLAVSLVAVQTGLQPGGVGQLSPAQALEQLSEVAAHQKGPSVGTEYDGYLHFRSENGNLNMGPGFWYIANSVTDNWVAADGSGRISAVFLEPSFPTEEDRRAWEARGRPLTSPAVSPRQDLGPGQLNQLLQDQGQLPPSNPPNDADALEDILRQHGRETAERFGGSQLEHMITRLAEWLRFGLLAPAQRAALYEVLARQPGVKSLGPTKDRIGRDGMGFSVGLAAYTFSFILVVDPATSALMGTETIQLKPQSSKGTVGELAPEDRTRQARELESRPKTFPLLIGWSLYFPTALVPTLP